MCIIDEVEMTEANLDGVEGEEEARQMLAQSHPSQPRRLTLSPARSLGIVYGSHLPGFIYCHIIPSFSSSFIF